MRSTIEIMQRATRAAAAMHTAGTDSARALMMIADAIEHSADSILTQNALDLAAAREHISEVMLDRLALTHERIRAMADGVRAIAALPCPYGEVLNSVTRPNGLVIEKIAVPIGVIAIIYESRPNVTSDAAALSLRSGNACILRCGKEAYRTSRAIVDAMTDAAEAAGMPRDAVQLVDDTSRAGAMELMRGRGYIDLLIPRGGAGLIRSCVENATIPTLETGTGICHIYVDKDADLKMAISIVANAKTSRPSVCNAAEVCLVHRDVAQSFLPMLKRTLIDERTAHDLPPVELRLCPEAASIIDGTPMADGDFDTEFLDYKLAVGIVGSVEEAAEHIAAHSTGHSEAIITENGDIAEQFCCLVDSAAVYVNASTRFTDGGEFGLGCEMGISTQRLHARGPIGLKELTTYKYIIRGNGQTR